MNFLIAFISLIALLTLHELGHFLVAKKMGVKVEEFGLGYPPKIWGKKIGQTVYSLNLLPFGAFVKLFGEKEAVEGKESFSQQPIFKRLLIVLGGVISFWIIASILFSLAFAIGTPVIIDDDETGDLFPSRIQIFQVLPHSPAQIAKLRPGDLIKELKVGDQKFEITKVKEFQALIQEYKDQEITLVIKRGESLFEVKLIPRSSPPPGQGPLGIILAKTTIKKYPLFKAVGEGIKNTYLFTLEVFQGYWQTLLNLFRKKPSFVEVVGPVGVFYLFNQAIGAGWGYFLQFVGIVAIYLAVVNLLPIPALDGGKALFLLIEAIRKKPVSQKTEEKITTFFFALLILLMIWVTIRDIARLF